MNNTATKERFAERVIDRLDGISDEQKGLVKTAILDEIQNYVVYSPEEAAEIILEPLKILDRYLKIRFQNGLAKGTISHYKYIVTNFICSIAKQIDDITTDDIRGYLNKKVTDGLSLQYVDNIRASLSAFFVWIFDEEYINRNPMKKIPPIKLYDELKPAFSSIEIDAIRRAVSGNLRDRAMVDFLLSTGCRVSELCNADISDISFEKKKMFVVGKGNKKRIVYLTDVSVCSLKAYLGRRTDDNPALFVTSKRPFRRMTPSGIRRILHAIEKDAHVEDVHPHRFRHTCCTSLLCRGMSLQDVSKILGHANVGTTMRYNNTPDEYIDNKFRLCSM